jgi:hypothetical protein
MAAGSLFCSSEHLVRGIVSPPMTGCHPANRGASCHRGQPPRIGKPKQRVHLRKPFVEPPATSLLASQLHRNRLEARRPCQQAGQGIPRRRLRARVRGAGESHPRSRGVFPTSRANSRASWSSMIFWSPIRQLANQPPSRPPNWSSFMSSLPSTAPRRRTGSDVVVAELHVKGPRTHPGAPTMCRDVQRTSQTQSSRARRPRPQGFTSCEGPYPPAEILHPIGRPKPS